MLKKTQYFFHNVCAGTPVITLCLKHSDLAQVSLSLPPKKAQSALIGQHSRVFWICNLGVSVIAAGELL